MSNNHVALLNEMAQKRGWTKEYEVVDTQGPAHSKTFTVCAVVDNMRYPVGVGRNKKEAKQNAAKNALSCLEKEEPANSTAIPCSAESFPKLTSVANYTCWLNEYSQKSRSNFKPIESTSLDSNTQFVYVCKYVCDDKEFPEAVGKSKKEAKETASKLVYEELHKERNTEDLDENSNDAEKTNMSSLSSTLSSKLSLSMNTECSGAASNFIGVLNQYCQKKGLVRDFKLVDKSGPPHNPIFVYKVVINKKEFPEGKGKTAKEAQHNAAELAWRELQGQSDSNFQTSVSSAVSEEESRSQTPTTESEDDPSSLKNTSNNQTSSDFIIFRDSANSPVPKSGPWNVKPKRTLAASFQNSPSKIKEDSPGKDPSNLTKPSRTKTSASNQTTKSRFLKDFCEINQIGKGGFGRVYKARQRISEKYYAVKIAKYTQKALREVQALADLEHANIVRYHTAWDEETAYSESSDSLSASNSYSGSASKFLYIQMELCEGETLRAWIDQRNDHPKDYPNRRRETTDIMRQVLEAVKYVHSKNLIHRDLKPQNIMFGNDEKVKVGDFGLCTTAEGEDDESMLERTKGTGTRSYMSPEQENLSGSYDRKVDVFALGLIYFELLWNMATKYEKHQIWKDIRNKMLPEGFIVRFEFEHKLILQMLSYNPEERPDVRELLKKLEFSPTSQLNSNENRRNWSY